MIVHACNLGAEIGVHHEFEIDLVFTVSTRPAGKYSKTHFKISKQKDKSKQSKTSKLKDRQDHTYLFYIGMYSLYIVMGFIITLQ